MTEEKKEITRVDIAKHYFATGIIYVVALFFMMLCPPYSQNVTNDNIDYSILLGFIIGLFNIIPYFGAIIAVIISIIITIITTVLINIFI